MAECYINKKDWDKILNYSQSSYNQFKAEIGGMAIMVEDEDGDWQLKNPVILKQEVSGGTTSIDKHALAAYYTTVGMKMNKTKVNYRFCWWHSHHTMAAFWSGTDLKAIDEYSDGDISFALVVNLKGEYKFRVSIWKPFEAHKDVELSIIGNKRVVSKKIDAEVKELCSEERVLSGWKSKGHYTNGYSGTYTTYNANQTSMFKDSSESLLEKEFNHLLDIQGSYQDKLIDGELEYKKYCEIIKKKNAQLERERSNFRLKELPDPINSEHIFCVLPEQFVTDLDGKIIAPDDEMIAWNQSFGVE
tara:strand:- start:563 stop:1471 length:909 start_codon:yes stop_codon:yes gene_type:complete